MVVRQSRTRPDPQLAERLFAIFPKREGVYTVLAYFDESEQHAEVRNAACISALTGSGLQWANVTRAWEAALEEYDARDRKGRRVFHSVEFETPEGPTGTEYAKWPRAKCEAFNRALLDSFAHSGIQAIAPSVIVSDYNEAVEGFTEARQAVDSSTADQFKHFSREIKKSVQMARPLAQQTQ